MKHVYVTTDPQEAAFLQMVLRGHDIESLIENESAASLWTGMPTSAVPLILSVADEDENRAIDFIKQTREGGERTSHDDSPEGSQVPGEADFDVPQDEVDRLKEKARATRARYRGFFTSYFLMGAELAAAIALVGLGMALKERSWLKVSGDAIGLCALAFWIRYLLSLKEDKKKPSGSQPEPPKNSSEETVATCSAVPPEPTARIQDMDLGWICPRCNIQNETFRSFCAKCAGPRGR